MGEKGIMLKMYRIRGGQEDEVFYRLNPHAEVGRKIQERKLDRASVWVDRLFAVADHMSRRLAWLAIIAAVVVILIPAIIRIMGR